MKKLLLIVSVFICNVSGMEDPEVVPSQIESGGVVAEKVSRIRIKWVPVEGVERYIVESKSLDQQNWWGQVVAGESSITIDAPALETRYRVRSIHPTFPISISEPSAAVFYPPQKEEGSAPNIVRTIGIADDGSFWEHKEGQWVKLGLL